jgi:chemotaxis response regulator CheB
MLSTGDNSTDLQTTAISFPIIGVGASAGGLEAIKKFLSGIPQGVDPGMAFVLVQHLAPDHKSILAGDSEAFYDSDGDGSRRRDGGSTESRLRDSAGS